MNPEPYPGIAPVLADGDAFANWQRLHPSGDTGARGAWHINPEVDL
ncbi:MAG TPA: hypothetical protein VK053_11375 [Jiangellaceae bacterium]|nr:hypothetical protein [Jiangellaceae bacterium]